MAASVHYYPAGSGKSESNRLYPAPMISITPEPYYANDTIIGYTHNITLNGYATSLDLRNINSSVQPGFSGTLNAIKRTKNLFNGNGGTLEILESGTTVFTGSGTIIRNVTFNESSNYWVNYSPYTIELECNEIQLANCSGVGYPVVCYVEGGSNTYLPSGIIQSPLLLDMRKYKVKSFNDNWTFSTDDNLYKNDSFKFRNEFINISYNISAQGKHYFKSSGLMPAWQQAKDFCQYRLHEQANRLVSGVLYRQADGQSSCATNNLELDEIFGSGPPGLIDGLLDADYKVFNEKITADASESDGTFDATYSCILKRSTSPAFPSWAWGNAFDNAIHASSFSQDISDDGRQKNIQITVNGSIQGLIPGGLVRTSGLLSLPSDGQLLINSTPDATIGNKYLNALKAYQSIITSDSGNLSNAFLSNLGVTYSALGAGGACDPGSSPDPVSFSTTHNFLGGTINYTATYDTKTACRRGSNKTYQNISVSIEDPTPIITEFVVPGRSNGPIIQKLNVSTPKKITITVDGALDASTINSENLPDCCDTLSYVASKGCDGSISSIISGSLTGIFPPALSSHKLTQNQFVYSVDGSYSMTRAYIICSGG